MRAKMMVVSNAEEIAEATELANKQSENKDEAVVVLIPKKETKYTDFLFDPNNVSLAYVDTNGGIRIIYNNQDLTLEYDKEVFKGLEENFNNRHSN